MKTAYEIKKGLMCFIDRSTPCRHCAYREGTAGCLKSVVTDALDLILRLEEQAPRWVGVTERMPKERLKDGETVSDQVLVIVALDAGGGYISSRYTVNGEWAFMSSGEQITHWMPCPEI